MGAAPNVAKRVLGRGKICKTDVRLYREYGNGRTGKSKSIKNGFFIFHSSLISDSLIRNNINNSTKSLTILWGKLKFHDFHHCFKYNIFLIYPRVPHGDWSCEPIL